MEICGFWHLLAALLLLSLISANEAVVNLRMRKQGLRPFFAEEVSTPFSESQSNGTMVFFEVRKPIDLPKRKPCSVMNILQHDFGYTYGKPPVVVDYSPPSDCQAPWGKVVLEWKATCKGRQYDRIVGLWLGGAEILRTCTAEPTQNGIEWIVLKDVTKYSALLQKPQSFEVQLNNIVDKTYTGVYHVNINLFFYTDSESEKEGDEPADVILPVSLPVRQEGGAWFQITNASDVKEVSLTVPSNAYRAVLEVFVSPHQNDEFWYTNPPNEYLHANNLTGSPGNGAFREVLVSIDGMIVGAVWPFPVIYTGGINPLFWRPVSGIGSFDLPSYDLDITPFLGTLLGHKQKSHKLSFSVANALDVWFVDANLHVWIDRAATATTAQLTGYEASSLSFSVDSDFKGFDGSFKTSASRKISSAGWVKFSQGKRVTHVYRELKFSNEMEFRNEGNTQTVHQRIVSHSKVTVETSKGVASISKVNTVFPLYVYYSDVEKGNGTLLEVANVSNAITEDVSVVAPSQNFFASLNNTQEAQGYILVHKKVVADGLGSTQQLYDYHSSQGCYSRAVSVSNYSFLYDTSDTSCGFPV
eukprot:TRINITY_DN37885_c0_g1_i1.p1 TRINITY_DN37885_c0_g1~~TRINITY_DN37885_c0_g1_i1.p1  ORF type:complete len:585 (+),score=65.97 TRINITY_DN37885_c0_g1_i1:171-1925(+)